MHLKVGGNHMSCVTYRLAYMGLYFGINCSLITHYDMYHLLTCLKSFPMVGHFLHFFPLMRGWSVKVAYILSSLPLNPPYIEHGLLCEGWREDLLINNLGYFHALHYISTSSMGPIFPHDADLSALEPRSAHRIVLYPLELKRLLSISC
jgi:hypothetical protein